MVIVMGPIALIILKFMAGNNLNAKVYKTVLRYQTSILVTMTNWIKSICTNMSAKKFPKLLENFKAATIKLMSSNKKMRKIWPDLSKSQVL